MKVIVFDIDGTVANIEHRRVHIQNGRRNWPAFNREMVNDTPHEDIMWLLAVLAQQNDVKIVSASGRGEEDRRKTENWLNANGLYEENSEQVPEDSSLIQVLYQKLYMRPARDSRKDSIIKREILDQIVVDFGCKPFMVFDDRNQVVDMWRENGIRCLQVAPGAF